MKFEMITKKYATKYNKNFILYHRCIFGGNISCEQTQPRETETDSVFLSQHMLAIPQNKKT